MVRYMTRLIDTLSVTDDQGYDPLIAVSISYFPHSCVITGFCSKSSATGAISGPCIAYSSVVFSGMRVAQFLVVSIFCRLLCALFLWSSLYFMYFFDSRSLIGPGWLNEIGSWIT